MIHTAIEDWLRCNRLKDRALWHWHSEMYSKAVVVGTGYMAMIGCLNFKMNLAESMKSIVKIGNN